MTDEQRYFDECQAIDNASRYSYARIGIICRDVERRELWKHNSRRYPHRISPSSSS